MTTKELMELEDRLHEVKRLIRSGVTLSEVRVFSDPLRVAPLEEAIWDKLEGLRSAVAGIFLLELTHKRLVAEFTYAFGRDDRLRAARELDEFLTRHGLTNKLRRSSDHNPFADMGARGDTQDSLRTKIWALMAAAFYWHHEQGRVKLAIELLLDLERVINKELKHKGADDYDPSGTTARLHQFLAQCYRTQRDFPAARDQFLSAQIATEKRVARALNESDAIDDAIRRDQRRNDDYQYSVISTARILGGLGRIAMHQGRLHRARQIFHSARTLLLPSVQRSLLGVIDSHIGITELRLAAPGSDEWRSAVAALDLRFQRFRDRHSPDRDGMRRCAQELARAHLEHAEVLGVGSAERDAALGNADGPIKDLDDLAALAQDSENGGGAEKFRAHLLRSWRHALSGAASLYHAAQSLNDACAILQDDPLRACALDLSGFDHVHLRGQARLDVTIARGILLSATAAAPETSSNGPDTRTALQYWASVYSEARASQERVVQLEALVRLAWTEIRAGLHPQAHRHLRQWSRRDGEHGFLKTLHRQALCAVALPPTFEFRFQALDDNVDSAREYLCRLAEARSGSRKRAAEYLGIEKSRIDRILTKGVKTVQKPGE